MNRIEREARIKELKGLLEAALLLYDADIDEYNLTEMSEESQEALSIELDELADEIDSMKDEIAELEKGE